MLSLYCVRLSEVIPLVGIPADAKGGREKVRREKETGRRLLYFVLTRVFGWNPERILLGMNEHGKPYLKTDASLFFNISHSGDWVVCAFSDTEVGVDIERIGKERLGVAERFFHPREIAVLREMSEQAELFFRYWSAKESVLKYRGTGLSGSLRSFYVRWEGEGAGIYGENGRLPLSLNRCHVDEGYVCFVCSEQTAPPELFRLTMEEIRVEDFDRYSNLLL